MFDRAASERSGAAGLLADPGARLLTGFADAGLVLAPVDVDVDADKALFLGRFDGAPLFVAEIKLDFRSALLSLGGDELSVVATAHHLLQWGRRTRFCSVCAAPVAVRSGGWVRTCTACNAEFFPRIDPVVMIRATHQGRILLARHHAYKQAWSTLAGFVEPGERIEEAAVRELAEETGVIATPDALRYFGSQAWPLPASVLMAFEVEVESDTITIDETELAEARFFTREELATEPVSPSFSISGRLIESWRS